MRNARPGMRRHASHQNNRHRPSEYYQAVTMAAGEHASNTCLVGAQSFYHVRVVASGAADEKIMGKHVERQQCGSRSLFTYFMQCVRGKEPGKRRTLKGTITIPTIANDRTPKCRTASAIISPKAAAAGTFMSAVVTHNWYVGVALIRKCLYARGSVRSIAVNGSCRLGTGRTH